jgi:hypothetical protein
MVLVLRHRAERRRGMLRMTPHRVLMFAASIMEERGLAKGVAEDDDGRVCLWGAVSAAIRESKEKLGETMNEPGELARRTVRELVRKKSREANGGLGYESHVSSWNDRPESTEKEMVALLREAAEEAKKHEEPSAAEA